MQTPPLKIDRTPVQSSLSSCTKGEVKRPSMFGPLLILWPSILVFHVSDEDDSAIADRGCFFSESFTPFRLHPTFVKPKKKKRKKKNGSSRVIVNAGWKVVCVTKKITL